MPINATYRLLQSEVLSSANANITASNFGSSYSHIRAIAHLNTTAAAEAPTFRFLLASDRFIFTQSTLLINSSPSFIGNSVDTPTTSFNLSGGNNGYGLPSSATERGLIIIDVIDANATSSQEKSVYWKYCSGVNYIVGSGLYGVGTTLSDFNRVTFTVAGTTFRSGSRIDVYGLENA